MVIVMDMEQIKTNEQKLREKYGKSARDLMREEEQLCIETCDVSKEMNELLKMKIQYQNELKEVKKIVGRMAGDAFIYYPDGYANNWINEFGIELFSYYGDIVIHMMEGEVEDDKIEDFCMRTGLELVDIILKGSKIRHTLEAIYIFTFQKDMECQECDECYCDCC